MHYTYMPILVLSCLYSVSRFQAHHKAESISMSQTPSAITSEYFLSYINSSRKLLLQTPLYRPQPPTSVNDNTSTGAAKYSMDDNLVMILALLLCALICALGLNSALRCALRCSDRMPRNFEPLPTRQPAVRVMLAQSGLGRNFMQALPKLVYHHSLKLTGSVAECAICLSEFIPGQQVRLLPACNHGFHVKCIDQWLMAHSSCPTCRQCLSDKCEKSSNCNGSNSLASSSEYTTPAVLGPLPREGLIASFCSTTGFLVVHLSCHIMEVPSQPKIKNAVARLHQYALKALSPMSSSE